MVHAHTVLLPLALACACAGGAATPPPATPPPVASRPSVAECKVAFEHIIEVALVAFDDDPEFRAEVMASVRAGTPGDLEARCHAEAAPGQVACLSAIPDIDALRVCAEPVHRCTQSEPPDRAACDVMDREWAWAAEIIGGVFQL
jgi:hypothetical protein